MVKCNCAGKHPSCALCDAATPHEETDQCALGCCHVCVSADCVEVAA